MAEFLMPALGADMTEGILLEWLVKPGSTVAKGDIVAVVDTDKASIEVECFDTGTVERLLVEPGARVPVGTPLAVILPEAAGSFPVSPPQPVAAVSDGGPSPVLSPLVRREAAAKHLDLRTVHGTGPGGRVTRSDVDHAADDRWAVPPSPAAPTRRRVSPRARRLAQAAGVDVAELTGTGPAGAVRAADVMRAAPPETTPVPAPAELPEAVPAGPQVPGRSAAEAAAQRASAMRTTIANLMARSKREIPHYYLTQTIDLTEPLEWLGDRNRTRPLPDRVVPAALLLAASARAAREVPELNGFWTGDRFLAAASVQLGVAISLRGGGLVAPAIADADVLGLDELMRSLKDLVARTRAGRLRAAELSSPTLTVSNLGEQGVESIIGVIYPPQVALVGFGAIQPRPWAVKGLIGIRKLVVATLAADHRATDGATGARYLRALERILNRPEDL